MVSGQWVSGVTGNCPMLQATASDGSGIQAIDATLETQQRNAVVHLQLVARAAVSGQPAMTSTPSVAQLADGRHTLRVSATDAAGNVGSAARDVLGRQHAAGPGGARK